MAPSYEVTSFLTTDQRREYGRFDKIDTDWRDAYEILYTRWFLNKLLITHSRNWYETARIHRNNIILPMYFLSNYRFDLCKYNQILFEKYID